MFYVYYNNLVRLHDLTFKFTIVDSKQYREFINWFVRYILKNLLGSMTWCYHKLKAIIEEYNGKKYC